MSLGDSFQIGIGVLRTVISDNGAILAQTGDAATDKTESDGVAWWQQVGLISRPSKAEPGKRAAEVVVARAHSYDVAIASRDLRGLELAGNQKEGETTLYAAGENGTAQARVALKGDGSVSLYTTSDNTKDGQSVYFRVAPDGFMFVAPWGTLRFDESGFHVTTHSGATFNMGGIGGLPAPLDQIGSYISGQAASTNFVSSAQSLGTGPVQPLASSPATRAALAALQAQVGLMQAAIAAFANPVTNPLISAAALDSGAALLAAATTGAAGFGTAFTAAAAELDTTTSSA